MPPLLELLPYSYPLDSPYSKLLLMNRYKAKRNYTIGIRTPWTLDNDIVWDKTHRKGEKVFKLTAILTLVGLFFSEYAFLFLFIPLVIGVIYLIVYSYIEYKKFNN